MTEYPPLGWDDEMPFGKFKHLEIKEIFEDDWQYLAWLQKEKNVKFSDDVKEGIKNKEMGIW